MVLYSKQILEIQNLTTSLWIRSRPLAEVRLCTLGAVCAVYSSWNLILKELLLPKTFNRFSYVANVFWIFLEGILFVILLDVEINKWRLDFVCGSSDDSKELIRGRCWEQYKKQFNKFGIPMYGFLIVNFCVTASVWVIYSRAVKSRVNELERRNNKQMSQADPAQPGKKLFKAYFGQLVVRIFLGIFFVLLLALLLYPRSFPSIFRCNIAKDGNFTAFRNVKGAQHCTNSYECIDQRAGNKTIFWAYAVIVVTGTFTLFVLVEMVYILILLPRKVEEYMEDPQFHKYYLKSKSNSLKPPGTDQKQPSIGATDERNNELSNSRRRPFRSTRSQHFLQRLNTMKSQRESIAVRNDPNRPSVCRPDVARFTIRNLNSQIEYVVKISVAPTCECEDYQKFKGNQLCKHIIWVYLYQLKVDEEHCLIQQIALERKMKSCKPSKYLEWGLYCPTIKGTIRDVRGIYPTRKKKRGKNPCCKAFRCKREISPGELCVFVEGLQVVQLEPPKVCQSKFCFCPRISCLQQFPLWLNLAFPTKILVQNDVSPSQIEKAKQDGLPLFLSEDDLHW